MPQFAIATAAYPTNPKFIGDFVTGVAEASEGHEKVRLVVAVEHGYDAAEALGSLPARVILDLQPASGPTTPAGLRHIMVDAAERSAADIVVFIDFDDRLLPRAFDLHAAALADAEVSYGDMELIDEQGRPLGRRFLDGTVIPAEVRGPKPRLAHNFIGFSNAAVRGSAITQPAIGIPDNLVAADWWFFTMLLASGVRAKRTLAPVANYRLHAQNTLGANTAGSADVLRRRARIAASHYAAIGANVNVEAELRAVTRLLSYIESDSAAAELVAHMPSYTGAWFEDVTIACRLIDSAKKKAASHSCND